MRIAIVHKDKCKLWHGCDFICKNYCPIARSGSDIIKEENGKPIIEENLCIGCGICVNRCPTKAISIINLPEKLNINPIHRYGKNGFELFNLPAPRFGFIVGILGVNGIGKSTIFKILSKTIAPNFGKEESTDTFEQLSLIFKGQEEQSIFLKMKDISSVAYKIQEVDLLVKKYGEKNVEELLKTADQKNFIKKVIEELDLKNILNRKINQLSGGELQKVLIAATSTRNAKLYLYDEPSSYLDIKERLNVAKFLRNQINEDIGILVVEHDLIMLDYLADYIYILYGKPKEYGIVSSIKTVREGINQYLDGFLKEENVRFRDYALKFAERSEHRQIEKRRIVEWSNLQITLGDFMLEVEEGSIGENEIVGILGENGIGKTTLVKALGGFVEYKGTINRNIKISYKPQYLSFDKDYFVSEFLKEAFNQYSKELIRPLNIDALFERKLSELSGGELQKVFIAKALSQDSDLYLLDEPTAYLDVEERIKVAKTIIDFVYLRGKSAIVVDHDIMFINYISNRLIVFEGEKSKKGIARKITSVDDGINRFLNLLSITMRKDPESKRPRINKEGSRLDKMQKETGKFYGFR
ncbi:MAG: ribosome biogenesis/translation initiation ATPase RLI [Candidatus Woesearchaeota archaeon]